MDPIREKCINGVHLVREYYWAGEWPVYLDNSLQPGETFDEVCSRVEFNSRTQSPAIAKGTKP